MTISNLGTFKNPMDIIQPPFDHSHTSVIISHVPNMDKKGGILNTYPTRIVHVAIE